jgi:hypothetical protein
MSHVTHEFPRAFEAASKVDPLILAKALDHIARTAARSRTSTRRLRWIEQRALTALRGDEYRDIDVDLPKNPGPDTHEKLQRRMSYHIAIKHSFREALQAFVDRFESVPADSPSPWGRELHAQVQAARALIAQDIGSTT